MLALTGVSPGVSLDLVAECAAHTPRRSTLIRRGALVGLLGHGYYYLLSLLGGTVLWRNLRVGVCAGKSAMK